MSKFVRNPLRLLFVLALVVGLMPMAAFAQDEPADIVDTAVAAGDFTTLVAAVQAAGLVDALKGEGPFTVFAPTDAAFAALPAGTVETLLEDPTGDLTQILLYHVVSGKVMAGDLSEGLAAATLQGKELAFTLADGAKVNGVNIVVTDIETSNGVIHVIDSVLLPPADEAAAEAAAEPVAEATAEPAAEAAPAGDIVDTAVAAGDFTTLVAAVQAAGLVDALKGEGPFTVFAPTDAAFAALPAGTVETLLEDPTGDLTQILLYHVVSGKVMAGDLSEGLAAATLQGKELAFTLADGAKVNGVNIVVTDIETSNGVIHVIDSVLLPPADEAAAEAAAEATAEPAAEAAPAAADAAPETMPVTGGETTPLLPLAAAGLAVVALAAAAFVTSKRAA